ncbi:cytochrome P450 3A11, partial [Nephila pilipes]
MFGTELFTGPLLITFSIGITSVLFLYWYYTRNFDYWKKKGIPYAEAVPFFGSTYSLLWKPWHEIELERHLKYGPLYGHFEGSRPLLSVADLKLVREILVKEFPSFSNRRMVNVVKDCSQTLVKNFKNITETGKPVNVREISLSFHNGCDQVSLPSPPNDSHNDPQNTVQAGKAILNQLLASGSALS